MATGMVDRSPVLSKRLWTRPNLRVIEDKSKGSVLKVLSGNKEGKSGQGASAVFWDELAEITDDEPWHRLYNSGMARKQPVWLSISTPQYQRYGLAGAQYLKAQQVLSGKDNDTEYLACIRGVPADVDWRVPDNWWPHIPALGITCTKDYILKDWETVQGNPREICRFRNHVLGQWTENATEWLSASSYDACCKDIDEKSLEGQRCIVAADMAINQLAAYVLFFPDSKTVLCRFFHPIVTARKSDESPKATTLVHWGQEGHINLTPGDRSDWDAMKVSLQNDAKRFKFIELAFDQYKAEIPMSYFQETVSCPVVSIPPTKAHVAEPTRQLERMVASKELVFQKCPVMRWCAMNAAVTEDAHDRITLDRDKAGGRYEMIACLVIALNRYLANYDEGESFWDNMIC